MQRQGAFAFLHQSAKHGRMVNLREETSKIGVLCQARQDLPQGKRSKAKGKSHSTKFSFYLLPFSFFLVPLSL
jgi:hypothetical protein